MNDFKRDQLYVLNTYKRIDLEIKKAHGSYLIDKNGHKYLDMYAGIAVNSLGHQHKRINHAIKKQMKRHLHLSNYFVSKPSVDLAECLVKNSFASKVFFTNSGTEAIEATLKIARKYGKSIHPDKTELIALHQSFHGRTLGALSLTGQTKYQDHFGPLIPQVIHIERNNIKELRQQVSSKTCGIYLEMIQGEGGIEPLTESFIQEVMKLTQSYDVLVIVDEIQTGLLRTGKLFAYQYTPLKPDLMTLAKSLGGGLPLGAVLVSEKLSHVLKLGDHGTTFGGNPLACAAGYEVLKVLTHEVFIKDVNEKSNYLFKELESIKKDNSFIRDIRGRGMMIGIDVGTYAQKIQEEAFKHKLLLNVTNQSVIRLLPPLNITYASIKQFLKVFEDIIIRLDEKSKG